MLADPLFAVEYSKLAFLVNIGRFNTRVSFDPHIRSTHKIYLSVPSLMTSPFSMSHLQDVSRMKSTLRSCLLNDEKNCPAATPTEVLHKVSVGIKPPTTVANLIFVLFTHAQVMSKLHFTSDNDFLDMFSAKDTPVMTRARAFLWLLFYYLEGPDRPNPWADAHTLVSPGKAPLLVRAEGAPPLQNVDTRKENQVGQTMREKRRHFLQTVHQEMSTEPMAQEPAPRPSEAIHLTHSANPSAPIPQTMLHHAWNLVHSLEPLQDSDEEYDKRDVQVDLERRLQVLQSVGLGSS
ncbi:hypothetical protein FRC03_006413 [Tulasnella sp. 419]|nr:hypothetical protein FRC03_006413 [Tulasnella sp. 419]